MKYKVVPVDKYGIINITDKELEDMLEEAYQEGYQDGTNSVKPETIRGPYTAHITPYNDYSSVTYSKPEDLITYTK